MCMCETVGHSLIPDSWWDKGINFPIDHWLKCSSNIFSMKIIKIFSLYENRGVSMRLATAWADLCWNMWATSKRHWESLSEFGSWARGSMSACPWFILRQRMSGSRAENGWEFITPQRCVMNDNQKWIWCCLAENEASFLTRTKFVQMRAMIGVIRWVNMTLVNGALSLTNFMEAIKRVWTQSTLLNFACQLRVHETHYFKIQSLKSTSRQVYFYCGPIPKSTNSSSTYYLPLN